MRVDVVLSPAEIALLPQADLSGSACVVFDVLRATSSIVTALHFGAESVIPVLTVAEAREVAGRLPGSLLAGERGGDPIPGFDLGNSPAEFRKCAGRTVVTTTTNGTVALRASAGAGALAAGALLNLDALAGWVGAIRPARLVLVCAGTHADFALEDAYAAGALLAGVGAQDLGDAARMALAMYERHPESALEVLRQSANGVVLARAGREADIAWCARVSAFPVVPVSAGGRLRRWEGGVQPRSCCPGRAG